MNALILVGLLTSASATRMNVLLLISDDLRPELGCCGGEAITPSLDKLAGQPGTVVFDRAYVQQVRPSCTHA